MDVRLWLVRVSTPAVVGVVLMLATVGVYAPHVARASFVYEDRNDVNTLYRFDGWRQDLHDLTHRPSRFVTGWTHRVLGFSPVREHLFNLLLHLANGLLVWLVASYFVGDGAAVLAAGFFWLHPFQVETVAYASARADLLMTAALLCGLWAVCEGHVGWAWVAACAAVLGKESGAAVFMLLPFVAWWRHDDWSPLARIAWALSIAAPVLAAVVTFDPGRWPALSPMVDTSVTQALALLSRLVWPVGFTVLPVADFSIGVLAATCGLAAALIAGALFYRRSFYALAVGSTAILLAPRLLIDLREGLHYWHFYAVTPLLMVSAARLLTWDR